MQVTTYPNAEFKDIHSRKWKVCGKNVKPIIQEGGRHGRKDPGGSKEGLDIHWKSPTSRKRVKHRY